MKIWENAAMLSIKGENGTIYPTMLWGGGGLALVDAGFPGQFDLISEAVKNSGFDVSDLSMLVFTHQDMDHIGCAREILKAAPGAKTACHTFEAPYISGDKPPVKLAAREATLTDDDEEGKAFVERFREGFRQKTVDIDIRLKGGDMLPFGGGAEVIHSPGHTPGHMFLYLAKQRILISGDGLNVENGALKGPNPVYTADMGLAIKSLEPLLKYDIKSVISYHGGLFEGDVQAGVRGVIAAYTA